MDNFKYGRIPKHWKWRTKKQICIQTELRPKEDIITKYIKLYKSGLLIIEKGYAWNGANVVPDTPNFLAASLPHDALYQLMSENGLDHCWKDAADRLFEKILMEDKTTEESKIINGIEVVTVTPVKGMNKHIANIAYKAVSKFGKPGKKWYKFW